MLSVTGALAQRAGQMTSIRYGTVVGKQTEIRVDDCVVVEEASGRANIRRAALSPCEVASQAIMNDPDIQAELQERASTSPIWYAP
jgi:uridine phosphorylase